MTDQQRIQKIYQLVNAIKDARRLDAIFMRDVSKQTDGTESWEYAAEIYNELFGANAEWFNICGWDQDSVIALS